MAEPDPKDIRAAFRQAVNMSPSELEAWLERPESHAVGWPKNRGPGEESVGHASGRRIVGLLRKRAAALTDDDLRHMRKVVGYVKRHLAQHPQGDITYTPWRYSLMNWGHDPVKNS